jgi:GST-like protein
MELIGSLNCGSIIVEMALALTGVPHRVTDIPYLREGPERERLLSLNPLGQVPTLVLDDRTVMTESAAILMYLNDLAPEAGLLPPPGTAGRAAFLNQYIRLVAAIYPTFTYGDDPGRWTISGDAAHTLRHRTNLHREALFRSWEAQFGPGPFAAGAALSALDLYLVAMTHWRPGHAWFATNTPRLLAAAEQAGSHPKLAPIVARHRAGAAEAA